MPASRIERRILYVPMFTDDMTGKVSLLNYFSLSRIASGNWVPLLIMIPALQS